MPEQEGQDQQQAQQTDQDQTTQQDRQTAPQPPPPDPLASTRELIESTRKLVENNARSTEAAVRMAQEIVQRRPPEAAPPPAPPEPDEEIDLADPRRAREFFDKRMDRKLQQFAAGLDKFVTDRDEVAKKKEREDYLYRAEINRRDARSRLPGYDELDAQIEAYVKDIKEKNPEVLARPGAYDEAFKAQLGEQVLQQRLAERSRAASVASSTRTAAAPDTPTRFDPVQKENLRRYVGVEADDDELALLSGPSSIEDFIAFKRKKAGAR